MTTLDRYTWDQAAIARLATARGFNYFNIPSVTIRRWVHEGHIKPAGRLPNGEHLYHIPDVIRHAQEQKRPRKLT